MNVHEPNTGAPTSTEHDQTGALLQDIADSSTAPASSSNKEADEGAKLPCSFFLRTGTCAYVSCIICASAANLIGVDVVCELRM